jgi:hypothetical protein
MTFNPVQLQNKCHLACHTGKYSGASYTVCFDNCRWPALFVAVNLGEKEDKRKAPLKEFFSYTVIYVLVSLVVCYMIAIFLWVLPFM